METMASAEAAFAFVEGGPSCLNVVFTGFNNTYGGAEVAG